MKYFKQLLTLILIACNSALFISCGSENLDSSHANSQLTTAKQTTVQTSALSETAAPSEAATAAQSETTILTTTAVIDTTPATKKSIVSTQMTTSLTSPDTALPVSSILTLSTVPPQTTAWNAGGNYTGEITINTASAAGVTVYNSGGSNIDASNSSSGYIMINEVGSSKRLKVQIIKDGMTYNYNLNNQGYYEVFPLQMGSGTYTVRIMENVSGSSYIELFKADVPVSLIDEFTPFLYPNQYVNYTETSAAVKKSFDLCLNASSEMDKLKSIYNYITSTVKYDKELAATVKTGYLPNVDSTLATKKGICFDYASLMACMLRSQNIPTKLVIGTAGSETYNHAWNQVYIKDTGWITVKIQVTGLSWNLLDPTFGVSEAIGTNYTSARIY